MNLALRKQFPKKTPLALVDYDCLLKTTHGIARAKFRDLCREEVKFANSSDSVYIEGQSI